MKGLTSIVLLVLLALSYYGQAQRISGVVRDAQTNNPIPDANVSIRGTHIGASTDLYGRFRLDVNFRDKPFFVELVISHIQYRSDTISVFKEQQLDILLEQNVELLTPVEVTAEHIELYRPVQGSLLDYEIWNNQLFTLEKLNNKTLRVRKMNMNGSLESEKVMSIKAYSFFRDCSNAMFMVGENFSYEIKSDLTYVEADESFAWRIKNPCRAKGTDFILFETADEGRLETIISITWKEKDDEQIFYSVADEVSLKMAHEEISRLEAIYGPESGMDPIRANFHKEFDKYFAKTVFYKEVYVPVFIFNDTIYLFDHVTGYVKRMLPSGDLIDQTEISYQNRLLWDRKVYQDLRSNTYYTSFHQGGIHSFHKVDIASGQASKVFEIDYPFPEKIRIHDGKLYYLYRKAGNAERKALFENAIRY